MINFGKRLRALRTEKGYTQKQLAELVGVRSSIISFYELGDRMPSPEMIVKLASVFHVTTDYLMGVERHRNISTEGLDERAISQLAQLAELLRDQRR